MRPFIIGWLMIGLLLTPVGCASRIIWDEAPVRPTTQPPVVPPVPKMEQKVKAGDFLIVTIWEHPELSRERTVSPEGFLRLPLLGDLRITNLTTSELEKTLTKEMTPYLRNPVISVERKTELLTQKITLLGAVAKPGNYEFSQTKEITLLPLLGEAGGYTEAAELARVFLLRGSSSKPDQRKKFHINLKSILADPERQDIVLQNNDIVILERTKTSKWNKTLADVSPTLYVITLILGISYMNRNLRD